ncbi:hypothetical protein [Siphonobacter curvatus]|uniref:Carboxypeptidase-like regulatory domain-containing protein n=1 Tax=Siphonobacter curvatus TaxID=2094562 RepID=A0A2S7IRT8_9BACT|nr:hypothetical protein [Siphonobacter curvatus]PQA60300.1 hypothetical protein C5O19_11985 [Siphonobacter curvatus]
MISRFAAFIAVWIGISLISEVSAQDRYITGVALNDSTQKPINLASVRNLRTQDVTRTNKSGTFLILARTGDQLRITCNGCDDATVSVDSTGDDIVTTVKQYVFTTEGRTLDEVQITAKSEAEIKYEIEKALKEPLAKKNMSTGQIMEMANSPISLMYELFSKRAKNLRKLGVLQQQDRKHKLAEFKYNAQVVNQVTKLDGEDLEEFMRLFPIDDDFVLQSSEYDLVQVIKANFKKYQARLGK